LEGGKNPSTAKIEALILPKMDFLGFDSNLFGIISLTAVFGDPATLVLHRKARHDLYDGSRAAAVRK